MSLLFWLVGSGAKPIWTIAVDQEDRQSVTVQDLLDRAADGLQVAMDWSTCEVHSLCVTDTQKTCEQLVLEPT